MYIISYKAFSVASFRGKVAVKYCILSLLSSNRSKERCQTKHHTGLTGTYPSNWKVPKSKGRSGYPKKQPNFRAKWRILVLRMKQSSGHPGFVDLFKVQLTQSFIPCWWQQFCNTLDIWNLNLWAGAGFQPSTLFYWVILNVPKKKYIYILYIYIWISWFGIQTLRKLCSSHELSCRFREVPPNRKLILCLVCAFHSWTLWRFSNEFLGRKCHSGMWGDWWEASLCGEVDAGNCPYFRPLLVGMRIFRVFSCIGFLSGISYSQVLNTKKKRMVDSTWQATTTAEHAVIAELVFLISFGCKNIWFFAGFRVLCE